MMGRNGVVIEPTALITALINTGGIAAVAGVLLYLHISTLRNNQKQIDDIIDHFREELAEERRQCHEDHEKILSSIALVHQSVRDVCRVNPWKVKENTI